MKVTAYVHSMLGFTLIELLVVVTVIGILATMAIANFSRMRSNAKRAACIAQQRGVLEAAYNYTIDFDPADGQMNVSVLHGAGFVPQGLCECPESPIEDFDDYRIVWQDDIPIDVDCLVKGDDHPWEP